MPIGAPSDTDTRDIAVIANTKVDQHVQDCISWRLRLDKRFDDMLHELEKLGDDNKSTNIKIAYAIGALIVLTKLPDLITTFKVMIHSTP